MRFYGSYLHCAWKYLMRFCSRSTPFFILISLTLSRYCRHIEYRFSQAGGGKDPAQTYMHCFHVISERFKVKVFVLQVKFLFKKNTSKRYRPHKGSKWFVLQKVIHHSEISNLYLSNENTDTCRAWSVEGFFIQTHFYIAHQPCAAVQSNYLHLYQIPEKHTKKCQLVRFPVIVGLTSHICSWKNLLSFSISSAISAPLISVRIIPCCLACSFFSFSILVLADSK